MLYLDVSWTKRLLGLMYVGRRTSQCARLGAIGTAAFVVQTLSGQCKVLIKALQTCVRACVRTCCQLVVEQQRRLPTELAAEQAAGLHREGVVVAEQQAADAEVRLGGVPQAGRLVGYAVVHVHLVALGTARGGTSADRQHIQGGANRADDFHVGSRSPGSRCSPSL